MLTRSLRWHSCVSTASLATGKSIPLHRTSATPSPLLFYCVITSDVSNAYHDSDNEDPMVRGLALRSLSSLRMESMLEYVEQPLRKAFGDISPYVRKTGVMAVLKV